MKKVKELIVLYPSFDRGGATANLINFINECISRNIKIYLISNIEKKKVKKIFSKKINVINNNNFLNIKFFERFFTSLSSIFSLITLFKKIKSENSLVVSFQSHIFPIIFTKLNLRKIIIRNSEDIISATKYADFKLPAYIIFFLKTIFYNFADGIITNSTRSKNSLDKIIFRNKSKLIFNPYLKKIYFRNNHTRKNQILSVGRFCKQKNQIIALKAFSKFSKKFKNFKLILIGDGKDKSKLKFICKQLNILNKVKFVGWVKNPSKFYLSSKLLIFPSLYEGLPNTLIDSVNFNLPCISSDCSGAKDILLNRSNLYYPVNDYKLLSKKMENRIFNYKKTLTENRVLKRNLNKFIISTQVNKYIKYCNTILNH